MTPQFSSRDEAIAEVRAAALARPAKKPKGVRYPFYGDLYQTLGPGDAQWTYPGSDPIQGTTVILNIPEDQRKAFSVLSEHEDGWYADYPVAPDWLFQSRDWALAETVFQDAAEILISERTLRRARDELKCMTIRKNGYHGALPPEETPVHGSILVRL